MKRITAATVAAATALTLAVSPAHAQEAESLADNQNATTGELLGENNIDPDVDSIEHEEITTDAEGNQKVENTTINVKNDNGSSGSSEGHVVAAVAGTLGAVLTTSLIVLSDPRGINKIIDALNRNFGLGLPHVYVPQVQLPNFQLPF